MGSKLTNWPWYSALSRVQTPLSRKDLLTHQIPPPKGLDSMVPQLFHEPTGTDAEQEAPTGQVINRGHLIGQYDRVPRWDGTDPGAKLQARGESGGQRT